MSDAPSSPTLQRLERLLQLERQRLERHQAAESHTAPGREGVVQRLERLFRYPLALAGIAWMALLIVITTTHGASWLTALFFALWVLFLVEYAARLLVTPTTTSYVRHRWLEPFAILFPPFLTAHFVGIEHATIALQSGLIRLRNILTHHALIRVVLGAFGIMIVGAWVVALSERHSGQSNIHDFGTALWWAIVTVTTVGYGDHFPVTAVGRIVATIMMMVGIGLIGTLTATVASIFVKDHTDEVVAKATEHHVTLAAMLEELKTRLGDVERRLGATAEDIAALDQQADTVAADETLEE